MNMVTRPILTAGIALSLVLAIQLPSAAASPGWVRLAHLSPDTPSVDVYLYAFGDPDARVVLEHVGYGALSPYQQLEPGRYTVAMRGEGADPASPPVISAHVDVEAGAAYTVAGMGRTASLKIQILSDSLTTEPGQASVRVIQASMREAVVDVTTDAGDLAGQLRFPDVSPYSSIAPGPTTVRASGPSDEASVLVDFEPSSIHTVVVLDHASEGLRLVDLTDASGATQTPVGGVNTGLGGAAPRDTDRMSSAVLWLVSAALLLGLLAAAVRPLGRARNRR